METFTITQDHIKLLQRMCVSWDDCEFGAPAIDCKRPYGNSGVESDIAEILGWEYDPENDEQCEKIGEAARKIHREMQTVLQIVLVHAMPLLAGFYRKSDRYDCLSWLKGNPGGMTVTS